MNFDQEKRLESEIDRELKALPELLAPGTLILRVMRAIEMRLNLPWYRQAWQRWPIGLQTISLLVLLALFGGLCFGGWKLTQLEGFSSAMHHAGSWFAGFGALWHALVALLNALLLTLKQVGTGFLIASFAALALAYALCISLGTVYVRLGMARR
jgi:hypothetical protein